MTGTPYVFDLASLFARVVVSDPGKIAIRFSTSDAVSYADLDGLAGRIAAGLASRHRIGLGDVVAIAGDKSVACYATLLAAIRLGAPYVMLDPDSPADRIERIFSTCFPKVVVGGKEFLETIRSVSGAIAPVDSGELLGAFEQPLANADPGITGETPAYIIYTSGSTGLPKGSVMTHSCVLNFISWSRTTYGIGPADVFTNLNPIYFDNSVFDIYSSLFVGGTLVPFTKAETKDPGVLVRKIDELGCTVWFSVPSLLLYLQTFRATDGRRLRSVRHFVFGGEGYPKARLVQLYRTYRDSARFHNVYGPSECTCICSSHELSDRDFESLEGLPPLGRMSPNFRGIVLGEDGSVLGDGVVGELCLQGPNVGKGYFNDPERTAAAFVQNPEHSSFRDIVYRTGDLVRRDPDGTFWFQGRRDNQIKHLGHRIELEEIEASLCRVAGVLEAAVVYASSSAGSGRILAVVVAPGRAPEEIARNLVALVPSYMMPERIDVRDALPKNANGKTSRRQILDELVQQ